MPADDSARSPAPLAAPPRSPSRRDSRCRPRGLRRVGFARAKIDDVARLAGVSKGTVYLYFDSKEALFREMVRAKVVAGLAEGEALVRTHQGSARDPAWSI